jgi:hypothetical protein
MSKKSKKKSKFAQGGVARSAAKDGGSKGGDYLTIPKDMPIYKEKAGTVYLDIIPYIVKDKRHPEIDPADPSAAEVGEEWYRRPFSIHRNIGVNKDSVYCPSSIGKKCPICEERQRQYDDGVDPKEVFGKTSRRNLYIVIPKDDKDHKSVPHLWDISQYNFQDCLKSELDDNPDKGIFPDLEQGYTLKVRFSEESIGKNSKFNKATRIDFKKRSKQYPSDMSEEMPCLDEVFKIMNYDKLDMLYQDVEIEDTEEDKPKKKKKAERPSPDFSEEPKRKKKSLKKEKSKKGKKEEEPKKKKTREKKSKEGKCPHGHKWAKDWDEKDDCDECKLIEACGDAHDELD